MPRAGYSRCPRHQGIPYIALFGRKRDCAKIYQPCAEGNRISTEHLAEIEQKIAELSRLAEELHRINGRCQGGGHIADCRIIEALSPA